jgi:TrpR-related protein YerC/YecD
MKADITYLDLEVALTRLDKPEDVKAFLIDLCTPAELRALSERWHVAQILDEGEKSYRDIQAETGVSTTTIGRVARFLRDEPHGGYRAVLDKPDLNKKDKS